MAKKKNEKASISVRISQECYEKLKTLAKQNGRMISGQIEVMVRQA